jgi:hypothetical protein
MPDRPLVRVGPYGVIGDWVQATCSRCGLLNEAFVHGVDNALAQSSGDRLRSVAYRHARDVHNNDVDREGWT